MQITAYPRTSEMSNEQWRRFRSYNFKRRDRGVAEVSFQTWFEGNRDGWPGLHEQRTERPANVSKTDWSNYVATRSYRKCHNLPFLSLEKYLEAIYGPKDTEKINRVIAKINAKARRNK